MHCDLVMQVMIGMHGVGLLDLESVWVVFVIARHPAQG